MMKEVSNAAHFAAFDTRCRGKGCEESRYWGRDRFDHPVCVGLLVL